MDFIAELQKVKIPSKYGSSQELLKDSEEFESKICQAPTSANWFKAEDPESSEFANESYPILHEDVLQLCQKFLDYKKEHGNSKEKEFYRDLSVLDLIERLISKRPLSFVGAYDGYILRDETCGSSDWHLIGLPEEEVKSVNRRTKNPLPSLDDYMSYDEIKLAAFLQVSSPVKPINSGSRHNVGRKGHGKEHVEKAVYVGAVGTRFEKPDFMEWQEMIVDKEQNTQGIENLDNNSYLFLKIEFSIDNGYGECQRPSLKQVFADLYNLPFFPTYEQSQGLLEFYSGSYKQYFNANVYRKRIQISAETFLIEANHRGQKTGQNVHVFIVGLGLGVWRCTTHQVYILLKFIEVSRGGGKLD